MVGLPSFSPLRIAQKSEKARRADFDACDHAIVVVPQDSTLPRSPISALIMLLSTRAAKRESRSVSTRLQNKNASGLTVAVAGPHESVFARLTWARKVIAECLDDDTVRLAILVTGFEDEQRRDLLEALLLALEAAAFPLPEFRSSKPKGRLRRVVVLEAEPRLDLRRARAEALGNNIARWFTQMPPNMLTARDYRTMLESLAKEHGVKHEFLGEATLKRCGAGAFLAVSQGNADRDAGILHLAYAPKAGARDRLALVGKGILFDTGGNNLKPFRNMLDMHTDMQGSAVAVGTLIALAALRVPYCIDAWLAITENRVSATAYKSQDVVTASNGTTIQVIHTDAEGRMVLADTLAIAAKNKPRLIIDYATLTGACVTALTNAYSGVFTNRDSLRDIAATAGRESGERIWPFPMDEDFDDSLKSTVADIKQCSEDGAGDHILAARFLSRFVPQSIPWIHVDLSAAQRKGGLGHVPSECTGFGVRWTLNLLTQQLRFAEGTQSLARS